MSEAEKKIFSSELIMVRNKIIYPVLTAVFIMIIVSIVGYFGFIRENKESIKDLNISKVDQEKFNEYLTLQQKINTLSEERQLILIKRVDKIEINIHEIDKINIEIARLQEKMKILLSDYGMKTRDGNEVILPIDYFITET